jgi:hypothetical protein
MKAYSQPYAGPEFDPHPMCLESQAGVVQKPAKNHDLHNMPRPAQQAV